MKKEEKKKDGKRRDHKRRILREGESQRSDGRYCYRYTDASGRHSVYSWKLEETDILPKGKKGGKALRTMESEIQVNRLSGIVSSDITVYEALEMHLTRRAALVKANTRANYKTILKKVEKTSFAKRKAKDIKTSDAKNFLLSMKKAGCGHSQLLHLKSALKNTFENCIDDNIILGRNPFGFAMSDIILSENVKKSALTKEQEKSILSFIKHDECYRIYYPWVKLLLLTGIRISEACGVTDYDIDFSEKTIRIDKQLLYRKEEGGAFIQFCTKTEAGNRTIPVSEEVLDCIRQMIRQRPAYAPFVEISGVRGFFYFTRDEKPLTGSNWAHIFRRILEKYNATYKKEIPAFTPHILRHTFATRLGSCNISPVITAAYMGHANAETTLGVYTHLSTEDMRISYFTDDKRKTV